MSNVQTPSPMKSVSDQDSATFAPAYRRLSRLATAGAVLAIVSLVGFVDVRLAVLCPLGAVFGVAALVAIRRHPQELTGKKLAWFATLAGPLFFVGSIAGHQVKLRLEVPEGYERISWRDLQPDERRPYFPMSEKAQELSGEKVYLRGYVYPSTAKSNLKRFVLVRDSGTCCFGGQPKLTDMIVVDFVNDKRINYSMWPRGIGGTFVVKRPEPEFSGLQLGAYYLQADHLK